MTHDDIATATTIAGTHRREMCHSIIMSSALLIGSSMLDISTVLAATTTTEDVALKFCGKFSDPINHPGGTRTITLIDSSPGTTTTIGDYRLARVTGGGGRGE